MNSPADTIIALMKLWRMKAFKLELIIMQPNPIRKYVMVGSLMSSITCTASLADCKPLCPRRNLPGPNTLIMAEFKMAQSSKPIAEAVKAK